MTREEHDEVVADLEALRDRMERLLDRPVLLSAEHRRAEAIRLAVGEKARLERLAAEPVA